MNKTWSWMVGALLLAAKVMAADDLVHYVSTNGLAVSPYTNAINAATNIQAAVDAAADGGTVLVAAGTYQEGAAISVDKAITIASLDGAGATIIDGQDAHRCFELSDAGVCIDGFTIRNGRSNYSHGGGVYCSAGGTIQSCIFTGNYAWIGGGCSGGTLINCILTDNASGNHGGGTSGCNLTGCTLSGNSAGATSAGSGGGARGGTLNNCIVWGNSAVADGNDIYSATVSYCCASDGLTNGVAGCITTDPCFTDADAGDYTLLTTSPCIDTGSNDYVTTDTDLAGNGRIYNGTVDLGAYEFYPPAVIDILTTNQTVARETDSIELTGTNNQWTVGTMFWTNSANAESGRFQVSGLTFQISSLPLALGTNTITVSGTNILGTAVSAAVIITRSLESGADDLTHYVSAMGSHTWPFDSWDTAATNIQDAVDTAAAGDAVRIAGGTYYPDAEITVSKAITIQGIDDPSETLIDGQAEHRCFNLGKSACVLSGLCLTNGYTSENGGGVRCADTTPVITNCTLRGNEAYYGGASMYGTLNNCTLSGNEAGSCGGGSRSGILNTCTLIGNLAGENGGGSLYGNLINCTLSGNSAGESGGGAYDGTLTGCTLSGNSAGKFGGGAFSGTLTGCTLSGNTVSNYAGGGSCGGILIDCTLSGNFSGNSGGGAFSGTLIGCTLSGNTAEGVGGGVCGEAALTNCVVWGNSVDSEGSDIFDSTVSYCCASTGLTNGVDGCITSDPCFTDAGNGDYTLLSTSPCINAGNNSYVTTSTDLIGNARIIYGFVDMGAYEYAGTLSGTPDFDGDGLSDSWEAQYADAAAEIDSDTAADSDAFSNEEEYIAGTDPTDGASYFHVTNCASTADGFLVEWASVNGRTYSILYTDSLTNEFQTLETDIAYPLSSCIVETDDTNGFFRVEVELEE